MVPEYTLTIIIDTLLAYAKSDIARSQRMSNEFDKALFEGSSYAYTLAANFIKSALDAQAKAYDAEEDM